MSNLAGELVTTVTEDMVRLDGFLVPSSIPAPSSPLPCEAAILVHGLSGNFYQSRLLKHFAKALVGIGIDSLLVNTRGHDYLNATPRMGKSATLGAAVEIIDECRYDLNAWVDFLVKKGNPRILLLGHSLGAIKSLYCQAHSPHESVAAICAFSATKLSYDSLLSSAGGRRFQHWLETAQQKTAAGKGDELLFVDFPFPTWISANAYLNKYGDGDRYNWLTLIDRIQVPTLAAFGEIEMNENPAFVAMADDLRNLNQSNIEIQFVAGADHFYSARFDAATDQLFQWLNRIIH